MGICAKELSSFVIKPTLKQLGEWSPQAELLLLGTAAQESGLGFRLKNRRSRGLGIYQIPPKTHISVWDKYLVDLPDLASSVRGLASQHEFLSNPHAELATNLSYATAIAWLIYRRTGVPLPTISDPKDSSENLQAIAEYWRDHFMTRSGKKADSFISSYKKFIVDKQEKDKSELAA